ncbi:uncharacterized protein EV422DRAFT_364339 [Fimicolochytrium jonesii]|uniref:uncharacterized protein n=1 Tax=Fimicolochytrium jonesii TaxID=1396493 RepID=UPI0022FE19A6|nr:uncharacterized protein EV422DRAFT_364339 [Fimicolochytrium jonesii]KAI8823652.1 hypothetical protein EV422DRAFT_364339 [Fimicolochytrium jonesii]
MQEVTIRQRSAFKHFVSVDSPGKELCWNFFTSKKNVSFGLFKKVSPSSTETGTYVLQSGARGDVGKSITVLGGDNERTSTPASPKPTRARGLSNAIPPSSSPAGETPDTTLLSPTSFKDVFQGKSLADFNDLAGTVRRRRKESVIEGDLVELVPVTHYESSKFTVKGSYYVEEPGTYVLLWDNSFSV